MQIYHKAYKAWNSASKPISQNRCSRNVYKTRPPKSEDSAMYKLEVLKIKGLYEYNPILIQVDAYNRSPRLLQSL